MIGRISKMTKLFSQKCFSGLNYTAIYNCNGHSGMGTLHLVLNSGFASKDGIQSLHQLF